jgi:hypothetical protein
MSNRKFLILIAMASLLLGWLLYLMISGKANTAASIVPGLFVISTLYYIAFILSKQKRRYKKVKIQGIFLGILNFLMLNYECSIL